MEPKVDARDRCLAEMERVSTRLECGPKLLLSPWVYTNNRYYVMGWFTTSRQCSREYIVFVS